MNLPIIFIRQRINSNIHSISSCNLTKIKFSRVY